MWRMGQIFAHGHRVQRIIDTLPDFRLWHTKIFGTERNIFFYCRGNYLIVRILKYYADCPPDLPEVCIFGGMKAIDDDRSFLWKQQGIHQSGKRGLPGSVPSEYDPEFTLWTVSY